MLVALGLAGGAAAVIGIAYALTKQKSSSGSVTNLPLDTSKKQPSTSTSTPGATVLPTSGKQAAPDPWTPVEFQKKEWPSWWPEEYQPW
jgi:hypothetical protein